MYKENSNDKFLYTCESKIDSYEYKKMAKYFPKLYWIYVMYGTLINFVVSLIIAILSKSLISTLVFFTIYQVFLMIIYKVRLEHFAEKTFNAMVKKGVIDTEIHIELYENYLIRQGNTETYKINYMDIDKCIETDTNFYLKYNKKNKIINIQKNTADIEVINFIRDTFKNLGTYHEDKIKVKYKNSGFKCTKNIVAGFIMSFLLLIYGSFCLLPTFSQDYNKIDTYKSIIDAELPSNGELEIQEWGTYFDEDKTEYVIINAYYDKEDVSSLVNSIENSSNWILSKEIKSQLKIFIPSQLRSDEDAYFSIYNKTTDQYNSLPSDLGDYEIYAMKI